MKSYHVTADRRAGAWVALTTGLLLCVSGPNGKAAQAPNGTAGVIEANVALGCSYVESGRPHEDWNGLTDGIKGVDVSPACYATDNDANLPKWVLLDLGRLYNVKQINVYNSLNGNTKNVALYVGTSDSKLTYLWKHHFPDRALRTFQHQFPEMAVRYVKVVFEDTHGGGFGGDQVMYLREVEVLARVSGDEVQGGVAESAVVVNFPRALRLLRRLTLARQFPLTVLIAGAEDLNLEEWTGSLQLALGRAFAYESGTTIPPRVVASPFTGFAHTGSASSLRRAVLRSEVDLVLLALRPGDCQDVSREVAGSSLVSSLAALCGELTGKTDAVVSLVLLPTPGAEPGSPSKETLTQLRAAFRQVGYLADVAAFDCESALSADADARPTLFDARGRLNDFGRAFVSRTLAETLKGYGRE